MLSHLGEYNYSFDFVDERPVHIWNIHKASGEPSSPLIPRDEEIDQEGFLPVLMITYLF